MTRGWVWHADRLADALRERVPLLVAGGPHATVWPDETLARGFDVAAPRAAGLADPGALAERIKAQVGETDEEGNAAIEEFAIWFGASFLEWLAAVQVMQVMGSGPVPTSAPPYVPVGPVVNMVPGGLAGAGYAS